MSRKKKANSTRPVREEEVAPFGGVSYYEWQQAQWQYVWDVAGEALDKYYGRS